MLRRWETSQAAVRVLGSVEVAAGREDAVAPNARFMSPGRLAQRRERKRSSTNEISFNGLRFWLLVRVWGGRETRVSRVPITQRRLLTRVRRSARVMSSRNVVDKSFGRHHHSLALIYSLYPRDMSTSPEFTRGSSDREECVVTGKK